MMTQMTSFVDYSRKRISKEAEIQEKVFVNWCNFYLKSKGFPIKNLLDLEDGSHLLVLLEILSGKKFPQSQVNPSKKQTNENWETIMSFLEKENMSTQKSPDQVSDSRHKVRLLSSIVWFIIRRYQIGEKLSDNEISNADEIRRSKKKLLKWVQSKIPHCSIRNFNADWRNGIALRQLVKEIHPGIPENTLAGKDSEFNTQLACRAAEDLIGIPELISPNEIFEGEVEDKSMMTYIALYRIVDSMMKTSHVTTPCSNNGVIEAKNGIENEPGVIQSKNVAADDYFQTKRNVAFGSGLMCGQVGSPAEFILQIHDPEISDILISIVCRPFSREMSTYEPRLTIKTIDIGTYTVGYTPIRAGEYTVSIYCCGEHIHRSPFRFTVEETVLKTSQFRSKTRTRANSEEDIIMDSLLLGRLDSITSMDSKALSVSSKEDSAYFDDDVTSLTSSYSEFTPSIISGSNYDSNRERVDSLLPDDSGFHAYGAGFAGGKIGVASIFDVVTPNINNGVLLMCIKCPALSMPVPSIRTKIHAGHINHEITYLPSDPGIYQLELMFGKQVIHGTPFSIS